MKYLRNLVLIGCLTLTACSTYVDAITVSKSKYGADLMGPPGVPLASSTSVASPNPLGIQGTINTKDAESLFQSLDAMVGPLGQKDQLAFMEAFFKVAYLDRCDSVGKFSENQGNLFGGRMSFTECLSSTRNTTGAYVRAEAYVADKRMDANRAYVASDAFGSWTGGRTQRESYVRFITDYGDVMDGKSADYIFQRNKDIMSRKAVSFR